MCEQCLWVEKSGRKGKQVWNEGVWNTGKLRCVLCIYGEDVRQGTV